MLACVRRVSLGAIHASRFARHSRLWRRYESRAAPRRVRIAARCNGCIARGQPPCPEHRHLRRRPQECLSRCRRTDLCGPRAARADAAAAVRGASSPRGAAGCCSSCHRGISLPLAAARLSDGEQFRRRADRASWHGRARRARDRARPRNSARSRVGGALRPRMLTAITRAVSPALSRCELTFLERKPIDHAKAAGQHQDYEELLRRLGARVMSLPAEPDLPDSMFVEDPAIVLDELAVILPLGTETRRREAQSLAQPLSRFRKLEYVSLPGTLEGGDVLRIGRKLFVGLTQRSNVEGFRQLAAILARYNYEVIAVPVTGCLHLKSAVTHLGRNTLLANRAWFDSEPLAGHEWIDVDPAEPHAANALALGGTIIFPASFPRTRARIEGRGFSVTSIDISELQKAESGLTCSSLLFETAI